MPEDLRALSSTSFTQGLPDQRRDHACAEGGSVHTRCLCGCCVCRGIFRKGRDLRGWVSVACRAPAQPFWATLPFSCAPVQFSCAIILAPVPFSWQLCRFLGHLRNFLAQFSLPLSRSPGPCPVFLAPVSFSWASVPLFWAPAQFFCAVLQEICVLFLSSAVFLGICAVFLCTCAILLRSFPGHPCLYPVHLHSSSAQFYGESASFS